MIDSMSKRIQVTVPDRLAEELEKWADYDGRPVSNLCAYLLERAVSEAKREGEDWSTQQDGETKEHSKGQ
ncbi:ribbon-helix-helix domain-containing protein [Leptothoe spongobia]|nr:hypothetical protein [Leptothoe spongobia]